jgi:murein L,D-transpeptidase YcbB/YkuD
MAGPKALWLFARFHGLMAARAFAFECGLITKAQRDAPVPADVNVPPGFEYWHAQPVEEVVPQLTRLLKLTDPYMYGEDIRWAQEQLLEWGYKPLATDGIYGPKTLAAVKAFQANKGLKVDGIVGPKTWAKLAAV